MEDYLKSAIKQFEYHKGVAERTFEQLRDEDLFWQYNEESNSIAIIVQHLHGNMLSRWTDFLTTDGDKPWRDRDGEFEQNISNRKEFLQKWNEGWNCLLSALKALTPDDWGKTVYIRHEPHKVVDAINRQLAHVPYHIGQIVLIGKMRAEHWKSLTVPKGQSKQFYQQMADKYRTNNSK
ncbi:DUF1572 family protein [Mucilaginibacter auburnensis]|uniref:Uncharacterized protein DUF1572 n=1 Tax=Mucilaginibacter auburnensis TaxID=1457233 RepID=A0A2H9VNM7_9SPHI|nr:DUF1572 family protein [Mucilaginibacter auburnensis]PJJ79926.1 uncharacterized protein DUF1572 [Mucilaginibacter auburnensis]